MIFTLHIRQNLKLIFFYLYLKIESERVFPLFKDVFHLFTWLTLSTHCTVVFTSRDLNICCLVNFTTIPDNEIANT